MFGLDWWILLTCTILFNIIWPPITLAITLYWGIRSTQKTLSRADAIEKKVTDAINEMEKEAKTEDMLAQIVSEQGEAMKQMMQGFKGDIIKSVDKEISEAKQSLQAQAHQGGKPDINSIVMAGLSALGGQ